SRAGVRVLLAVDTDDVVHEIDIGLPDTKGEAITAANLGARLTKSGNLVLADLLPKGQVATMARRKTLENGKIIHVVMTWGFDEYPDTLTLYAHLYVFCEQHNEVNQIFGEELGSELDQFIVEDINHDGKIEILASTRENAVTVMHIWQIQLNGQVKEIQKIEGYSVHTQADRFLDQDQGIIVEQKIAGSARFKTDEYIWSAKQQRFVKH
ncbi:MAG TPA: hypothetical protein VJ723_05850, partial [Candidatus Angelobacter sp.]|nr:hypothetical protein [Candidatus Angelobacter sp.]